MYSISNIILLIEMSVVNLKIIFVKKQKRHPNAQLKAGGEYSFIGRNGLIHTTDRLFVRDGLSV